MTDAARIDASPRLLFVVSAPSGTGKTSLCTEVLRQVPNLCFSVSHTTRPPRPGEVHGENYYFVSRDVFMDAVSQGRMAEWTEIYGNCYGTAKATIETAWSRGLDLFFDVDERGARQLSDAYPHVVTILVLPPSLDTLHKRLVERKTEGAEALRRRLERAREEIKNMAWYRYVMVNDQLQDAVAQLRSIIVAERCRHAHGFIARLLDG